MTEVKPLGYRVMGEAAQNVMSSTSSRWRVTVEPIVRAKVWHAPVILGEDTFDSCDKIAEQGFCFLNL